MQITDLSDLSWVIFIIGFCVMGHIVWLVLRVEYDVGNLEEDVKARDKDGLTLLHKAARDGSKEQIELLITKGANVEARDTDGITPFDIAKEKGRREIIKKELLDNLRGKKR